MSDKAASFLDGVAHDIDRKPTQDEGKPPSLSLSSRLAVLGARSAVAQGYRDTLE